MKIFHGKARPSRTLVGAQHWLAGLTQIYRQAAKDRRSLSLRIAKDHHKFAQTTHRPLPPQRALRVRRQASRIRRSRWSTSYRLSPSEAWTNSWFLAGSGRSGDSERLLEKERASVGSPRSPRAERQRNISLSYRTRDNASKRTRKVASPE